MGVTHERLDVRTDEAATTCSPKSSSGMVSGEGGA